MTSEFGPITDYLPHRPPMLLITHIDSVTDTQAVCRALIQPDCIFAIDGKVHPLAMIEFVAQVCAIAIGVDAARKGKPPRLGFIIGSRECTFNVNHFNVGDELTLTGNKVIGEEMLGVFNGFVFRDGVECARVQISAVDAELAGAQLSSPQGAP